MRKFKLVLISICLAIVCLAAPLSASAVAPAQKKSNTPARHGTATSHKNKPSAKKNSPDGTLPIKFEDENFKSALIAYGFDTNHDGEISYNEAAKVTRLTMQRKNISHMPEIKYFTNLEVLSCDKNELTTLDVSNNAALRELSCWGNHLTSINLSNNKHLRELICTSNNLGTLDISQNPELRNLMCEKCNITSLDVSHNSKLTSLHCEHNRIGEINLSNNPELQSLWCQDNAITVLDLANCKKAVTLYCSDNPITSVILPKGCQLLGNDLDKSIVTFK